MIRHDDECYFTLCHSVIYWTNSDHDFFLVLLCLKSWLIQVVLCILDDALQSGATNQMLLPVELAASEANWDKLIFWAIYHQLSNTWKTDVWIVITVKFRVMTHVVKLSKTSFCWVNHMLWKSRMAWKSDSSCTNLMVSIQQLPCNTVLMLVISMTPSDSSREYTSCFISKNNN